MRSTLRRLTCALSVAAMLAAGLRANGQEPAVTFTKDVAPILNANCVTCHRPGEVAPFALLTYADAKKRAAQIADVTHARLMPPWKADAGADVFRDARRLTDEQIGTLKRWAEAGAPEGNPVDLPPAPSFTEGWQLGEPDVILEPAEAFQIPAEGSDVYRCMVFPTDYGEDRYVSAMEVRAGNRSVVHHAMGYIDTTGTAVRLDAADPGPGYTAFGGVGFAAVGTLDGWGPGVAPRLLPEGVGMQLPSGAAVVVQLHYHPTGKPETDRTRIGLHFSKKPVDKRLNMAVALNLNLTIPAGDASHEERATLAIPQDITLHRIAPHMHLLGREMTVTAVLPDGTTKKLVRVPDWSFNWQSVFTFVEPVNLPKGSRVDVVGRFDNSADNPANPSRPPREVRWGEQTTDEMCVAALFYTVDAEHLTKGVAVDAFAPPPGAGGKARTLGARERIALGIFDKNADGRLDVAERDAAMKFIAGYQGHELSPSERAGAEQFLDQIGGKPEGDTAGDPK